MKKRRTPTTVSTAILTLITIFIWAGFEVYRALTVKQPPIVPQAISNPLNPALDINTLNSLNQRLFFSDDQIGNSQQTLATATPQASASPIPVATQSPVPATSSGVLSSPTPTP